MAAHLPIFNNENQKVIDIIDDFLLKVNPNNMVDFLRYNEDGKLIHPSDIQNSPLVFQKLTDRDEEDDRLVISVYSTEYDNFIMYFDGEEIKGAIAEVHIKKHTTMQIYCVI